MVISPASRCGCRIEPPERVRRTANPEPPPSGSPVIPGTASATVNTPSSPAPSPVPAADQPILHPCVTPSIQLRTLQTVLDSIRAGRGSGDRPVVEIDLDLCALRPAYRTRRALETVGNEFGIPEFLEPRCIDPLPGYSDEAWLAFLDALDLECRHPRLIWKTDGRASRAPGTPFGRFHALYWTVDWMVEDSPTPGLGAFVHLVEREGGRVVFLSGRWLDEHRAPTLRALRRAGIPDPQLVIGNPWHPTLVADPAEAVSDARIKAWHQQVILRDHGQPVAIVDDRQGNRDAVVRALPGCPLSIAIAIPGFTCDPATLEAPLRLSTFESFAETTHSGPPHPHLRRRYPDLGHGMPWRGLYEGLGRNDRAYILPRTPLAADPPNPNPSPSNAPFADLVAANAPGSLTEESLLDLAESTIPPTDLEAMRQACVEAEDFAARGLAAPFPASPADRRQLWHVLVASWLHSRDIETLMGALGYSVRATGIHDMLEFVDAREVIELILPPHTPASTLVRERRYSEWLRRWAATLDAAERVNVGLLNPALLVDFAQWNPSRKTPQDSMDVHRLSDHHEGDLAERYDPVEASINNLLHQREGACGVRKEPVSPWPAILASLERESAAENLCRASVGRDIVRDAARLAARLEELGRLTPWQLVQPTE